MSHQQECANQQQPMHDVRHAGARMRSPRIVAAAVALVTALAAGGTATAVAVDGPPAAQRGAGPAAMTAPEPALAASHDATTMAAARMRAPQRTIFAPTLRRWIIPTVARYRGAARTTWYGPGFWGNRTACGQRLQRGTWGVAHRTLPCGTMVVLRYGTRRVAVPVIDRGPFSHASLDLTQRTADYLGFRRAGTGLVHLATASRWRYVPR